MDFGVFRETKPALKIKAKISPFLSLLKRRCSKPLQKVRPILGKKTGAGRLSVWLFRRHRFHELSYKRGSLVA